MSAVSPSSSVDMGTSRASSRRLKTDPPPPPPPLSTDSQLAQGAAAEDPPTQSHHDDQPHILKSTSGLPQLEDPLPHHSDVLHLPTPKMRLYRVLTVFFFGLLPLAMTIPIVPALLLRAYDGSTSRAAYFTAVSSTIGGVLQAVTNPLFGRIADIRGRKLVILVSLTAGTLDYLLLAAFPTDVWVFAAISVLSCLSWLLFSVIRTCVADLSFASMSSPSETAGYFGLLGAVGGAALALGPAVGGLLAGRIGDVAVVRICAMLAMANVIFAASDWVPETASTIVPENTEPMSWSMLNPLPSVRTLFVKPRLKWLSLSLAMTNLADGGLRAVFVLYCAKRLDWGSTEVGLFFSVLGVTLMISEGLLPKYMVRHFGERNTVLIGVFCETMHFVVYAFASSGWIIYLGVAAGIPRFISSPTLRAIISKQVGPDEQGALQGSLTSLSTVIQPVAPLVASSLLGAYSETFPGAPMFAMAAISSFSIVFTKWAFDAPQACDAY